MRQAICLVLPSYHENFGMSVLEALSVACPVVVTREVGLARVVRDCGCGLVTAGDHRELAEAIQTIVSSPQLRIQMGEAGARTAANKFGWPAIATQMLAVYRECLEQ